MSQPKPIGFKTNVMLVENLSMYRRLGFVENASSILANCEG